VSIPAVASVAPKLTESGALYQPFCPAERAGVAVTWGAVASYLSGSVAEPTLPAKSTHVPLSWAAELSGPE
jgi:hypothetical protein